jgi:hypothetical protein
MEVESPVLPPYFMYGEQDENGVDVSLIRAQLAMSPRERVEFMDRFADDCLQLLEIGRRNRERKTHQVL